MGLIVGCCGTGGLGLGKYLSLLTSMEVQDTFYRKVKTSTLKKWREKAGEDFIFTIKAFQGITHPASSPTWKRSNWKPDPPQRYGLLRPTKENLGLWEEVLEWADVIKAKAILVQLPPSFNNTDENRRNVFEFFSRRERFEIAIEFRHSSWFNEEIGKWMDEKGILQALDIFAQPKVSKRERIYVRLHGKARGYRYQYTNGELVEVKERVKEGYVMFNNLAMIEDCLRFMKLLEGEKFDPFKVEERIEKGLMRLKFPITSEEIVRRYGYLRIDDSCLEDFLKGKKSTISSLEELRKALSTA